MMSHWTETARHNPVKTAATAAGAAAAGVFLWSKRNQISDQIGRLSNQVSDWADEMRSGSSSRELATTAGPNESSAIESSRATGSRTGRSTGRTAKARQTSGRAVPQRTTM
jgi:hypothetical protein